MTATARQIKALRFFLSKGYTGAGAAAIVGNASQESGNHLDTTVYRKNADQGSGGLLEWRNSSGEAPGEGRKDKFVSYMTQHFPDDTGNLEGQCAYVIVELHRDNPRLDEQLRFPGRSVANLTANFMQIFERPSARYAGLDNRIKQANACVAATADDPVKRAGDGAETGGAIAVGGAAAGGAAYAWTQGLSGTLVVALVIFTMFAILVLAFKLWEKWSGKHDEAVTPVSHPTDELQAAIDEFKLARSRLDAAEAVLLADRQQSDALLAQVKELRNGR